MWFKATSKGACQFVYQENHTVVVLTHHQQSLLQLSPQPPLICMRRLPLRLLPDTSHPQHQRATQLHPLHLPQQTMIAMRLHLLLLILPPQAQQHSLPLPSMRIMREVMPAHQVSIYP